MQERHPIIQRGFTMPPCGTATAQSTAALYDQNLTPMLLDGARETQSRNAGANNSDVNFPILHICPIHQQRVPVSDAAVWNEYDPF